MKEKKHHLGSLFRILQLDKNEEKNIPIDTYLLMIVILFGVVFIFGSQIYIKNNIYYVSRKINVLYIKYQSIKDENKVLKRRLEYMRFMQEHNTDK
jgi:cell division protein FtsB